MEKATNRFIRALKVDGSQLYLKYSFKRSTVYIMDSLPENYPIDRYAHLSILDQITLWLGVDEGKNNALVSFGTLPT